MTKQELQKNLIDALIQNHRHRKMANDLKQSLLLYPKDKNCHLNVGDYVVYQNDYGVKFSGFRIIGFDEEHNVYLNSDCFWSPKPQKSVTLQPL